MTLGCLSLDWGSKHDAKQVSSRHVVKWKWHKDSYTTQWLWRERLWPQSPPESHTHTHTHCLSTELRHKKHSLNSPGLSSVCLYFLCTRWHAHVCARVCLMNPRGESSDGGGGVAVPQWKEERRSERQDEESFSCSEGSQDPLNSKRFHSEQHSMKRQGRRGR